MKTSSKQSKRRDLQLKWPSLSWDKLLKSLLKTLLYRVWPVNEHKLAKKKHGFDLDYF